MLLALLAQQWKDMERIETELYGPSNLRSSLNPNAGLNFRRANRTPVERLNSGCRST